MRRLYHIRQIDDAMSSEINEVKEKALKEGVPIIKDEGLAFLLNYIEEHKCKQILELGTAMIVLHTQKKKIILEINSCTH